MKIPSYICDRILVHLCKDADGDRNCLSFFTDVLFSDLQQEEFINEKSPAKNIIPNPKPDDLKPGDGVMLFRDLLDYNLEIYVKNSKRGLFATYWGIYHYAIYLGDGLCISKCGWNGPIVIQDLHEMMDLWDCKYFYQVQM
jgi:L-ascorbate metabolism protein UlaG (beta-lactamase superfamily)